jgi:hypothetical protein
MRISDAKAMVLGLMERDLRKSGALVVVDPTTPDPNDEGKFKIDGKAARIVLFHSGWATQINQKWFEGSYAPPEINGSPFHWYVYPIRALGRWRGDHYYICDYLQMREWVLEFAAPQGKTYRDQARWRADLRPLPLDAEERRGYFRWGDEPIDYCESLQRVIPLDNIGAVAEARTLPQRPVGIIGPGGESAAHASLKQYIAKHPTLLGLSIAAEADVEHRFCTGDRVDVLFNNHQPDRTVVEVEVAGSPEILIGIHQAIKYRSLAEAENSYPPLSPRVRAHVVAYETDYPSAIKLASSYDVHLLTVDRRLVLGPAC